MRVSTRSASSARPRLASQRGDSGSTLIIGRASKTGSAPKKNIHCQPNIGTTNVPTSATVVSPMGNMSCCMRTKRPRFVDLANSLI